MKTKSEQKCNTSMSFSPYVMTFIQEMASKKGCSVSSLYEKAAIEYYNIRPSKETITIETCAKDGMGLWITTSNPIDVMLGGFVCSNGSVGRVVAVRDGNCVVIYPILRDLKCNVDFKAGSDIEVLQDSPLFPQTTSKNG